MSKLEEIKRAYNYPHNNKNGYPYWLINRVEELEEEKEQDSRQKVLEGLHEENQRYKQALEFYAERMNYEAQIEHDRFEPIVEIGEDGGYRARQALKDESD